MKFVALVSGGKDSIYSILHATQLGHELVACVHLGRPREETEESYMYQTAGSEAIRVLVEECMGVPLILHERVGKSVNTSLVYEHEELDSAASNASNVKNSSITDEVEDLHHALLLAQQQFPGIQAVASGAILSTYQRVRIEHVCQRLGLLSLSFLWRRESQAQLLQSMIQSGIYAVLVRVAAPPGLSAKHLGQSLQQLQPLFETLHARYQFSVCGEGGEFETLVLDCPLYKQRLVLDETKIVQDGYDGVADLMILSCHAEPKDNCSAAGAPEKGSGSAECVPQVSNKAMSAVDEVSTLAQHGISLSVMPRVCRASGGLFYVPELMAPTAARSMSGEESESDSAVAEALAVFRILQKVLTQQGATAQDVLMVNLYLSEMAHFAAINQHYRDFFGTVLPPSRSCIGIGTNKLPGGRRVLMDCIVQCGSGQYMRAVAAGQQEDDNYYANLGLANANTALREVLHVQSISYWAPVCVGPYSQVNTLRGAIHFVAGQIGLRPETMTLCETWTEQLEQAWVNTARVLDAVKNASLENVVSGLVYVSTHIFRQAGARDEIEAICHRQRSCNGGVSAGAIDGSSSQAPQYHGYEDEGTMKECMDDVDDHMAAVACPLLVVAVPDMPVGALAEVEVVAATSMAVSACPISVHTGSSRCKLQGTHYEGNELWTGYDPPKMAESGDNLVHVDGCWVSLGPGTFGTCLVTASVDSKLVEVDLDAELVFGSMLNQLSKMCQSSSQVPDLANALHLRLFYVAATERYSTICDGIGIQTAFRSAISTCFGPTGSVPAVSVIPADGLHTIGMQSNKKNDTTILFSIRASVVIDPVGLETELWIRARR